MATIRGARALGMEKEIGSLEAGKRADLIMVRIDRPHAVPLYDAVSQMVYALKARDVRDVMVNGKPVVRDGRDSHAESATGAAKGGRISRQDQCFVAVNLVSFRLLRAGTAGGAPMPPLEVEFKSLWQPRNVAPAYGSDRRISRT